jgi:hypothetical protein
MIHLSMQEGTEMTKVLRNLFLAGAIACGSAQAGVAADFGTNPVGEFLLNSFDVAGSFNDQITFNVNETRALSSVALSQWTGGPTDGLRNLTLELFQGSSLLASAGPSTANVPGGGLPAFTIASLNHLLTSGNYRLELTGDVQALGGNYVWTVNTVAIPEPEQWALLIAGLALVAGAAARRRKNGSAS